jgi:nuclease-like protein
MPDHSLDPRHSSNRLNWSQPQPSNDAIYRGVGLTVRAYTAEELRARLDPPAPTGPAPPTPITAPPAPAPAAPLVAAGETRPGASARTEYRRRRAGELTGWIAGLPWRLAVVAVAALAGQQLATRTGLLAPWLAALAVGGGVAWRLRFRASQPTRAWRDGARGERATARRLRRLERCGYTVLHDLAMPGSRANLDHIVIGPSGVFVIASKRYRGRLHQTPDGMLWHGHYPLAQALATLWWEARLVGDTLGTDPQVPITPLLVIHHATIPWGGLVVADIPVVAPGAITEILGLEPVLPAEEVDSVTRQALARLRPAGLRPASANSSTSAAHNLPARSVNSDI